MLDWYVCNLFFGLTRHVMQRNGVTKHLGNTNMDAYVDVLEILPPYGRLDDTKGGVDVHEILR